MILISGLITVDPSDHDAMVALTGPLVEATLAEEGCGTYGFWSHPAQPGTFRVYEEWADDDALTAHMGAAHMAEFLGGMAALSVTGTEINRYDVDKVTKFM